MQGCSNASIMRRFYRCLCTNKIVFSQLNYNVYKKLASDRFTFLHRNIVLPFTRTPKVIPANICFVEENLSAHIQRKKTGNIYFIPCLICFHFYFFNIWLNLCGLLQYNIVHRAHLLNTEHSRYTNCNSRIKMDIQWKCSLVFDTRHEGDGGLKKIPCWLEKYAIPFTRNRCDANSICVHFENSENLE